VVYAEPRIVCEDADTHWALDLSYSYSVDGESYAGSYYFRALGEDDAREIVEAWRHSKIIVPDCGMGRPSETLLTLEGSKLLPNCSPEAAQVALETTTIRWVQWRLDGSKYQDSSGNGDYSYRDKLHFRTPERWQSGRMRRFAKPLYGLTPVPRVRIPPSPPVPFASMSCEHSQRVRDARKEAPKKHNCHESVMVDWTEPFGGSRVRSSLAR
jgi:hypothetical protein